MYGDIVRLDFLSSDEKRGEKKVEDSGSYRTYVILREGKGSVRRCGLQCKGTVMRRASCRSH